MRFVLELAILIIGSFIFFKVVKAIFSSLIQRRKDKKEKEDKMWQELRRALGDNSKQRLEDIFILYNKDLPAEIKPIIQSRIDDLIIKESDIDLENSINRKL